MSAARSTVQDACIGSHSSRANSKDERLGVKSHGAARQPTLFPWVSPGGSRSPSFVRCGLQGGQRTRGYGSVPRRGSRQTSQHRAGFCGRAVRSTENASLCTQTAEPGVASYLVVSGSGTPRRSGMQACRYAASLIQGKPGKGEGLGDPGVLFWRVSRIGPCSRPWSTRRVREAEEQRAVFFGRALPIGPRKRKPDSAPFPSPRRQPNQMSTRLVHRDKAPPAAVQPSSCCEWTRRLLQNLQGTWHVLRCRISGAGKGIAR